MLPAQGSILISEPFLQDAYFQRSVVLLVEHTQEGSMGFVLNKKTELSVNTFFADLQGFPEMPIYLGGPVSANRLFFIHSLGDLIIPNSLKINDHLYFDGDFSALIHYIQNGHPVDGKVKFFLGYSGWQEGQLHNEIDQNSWVVSMHPTGMCYLPKVKASGKNRSNRSEANMKRGPNTRKNPR